MTTKQISARLLSLPLVDQNLTIDPEKIVSASTNVELNDKVLITTFIERESGSDPSYLKTIPYDLGTLYSKEKAHLETFLLLAKNGSIEPSIINTGNGQITWLVLKNTN